MSKKYVELAPIHQMMSNTVDQILYDLTDIKIQIVYEAATRQIYLIRYENIQTVFCYFMTDITKCDMIPQTMGVDINNYVLSEPIQFKYLNEKYYTMGTRGAFNSQLPTMHVGESCTYNDLTIMAVDTSQTPFVVQWYKFNARIQAEYCPDTSLTSNASKDLGSIDVTSKTANSASFTGFSLSTV